MTDAALVVLWFVVAPTVILGLVAMIRGYHLLVRLYRPGKNDEEGR